MVWEFEKFPQAKTEHLRTVSLRIDKEDQTCSSQQITSNRPGSIGPRFFFDPFQSRDEVLPIQDHSPQWSVAGFEPAKISIAMTKAFIAVNGGQGAASARVREVVARLTDDVVKALIRRQPAGGTFHIEDIQDQVELALMRSGEHDVARAYVLYREDRARKRAKQKETAVAEAPASTLNVLENGAWKPLDTARLLKLIESSCVGLGEAVNPALILKSTLKDLYDGVPMDEVQKIGRFCRRER